MGKEGEEKMEWVKEGTGGQGESKGRGGAGEYLSTSNFDEILLLGRTSHKRGGRERVKRRGRRGKENRRAVRRTM